MSIHGEVSTDILFAAPWDIPQVRDCPEWIFTITSKLLFPVVQVVSAVQDYTHIIPLQRGLSGHPSPRSPGVPATLKNQMPNCCGSIHLEAQTQAALWLAKGGCLQALFAGTEADFGWDRESQEADQGIH